MNQPLASFRELRGVGPGPEARLHEAGVHTWKALSDVLDALSDLRDGCSLQELADQVAERFVEEQAGITQAMTTAPVVGGARTAAEPPPEAVRNDGAVDEAPSTARTSRHHQVVLDAGTAIGGTQRRIDLTVSTTALADVGEFAFSAILAGRPVGQAGSAGSPWVNSSGQVGRGSPPGPIRLRFDGVPLPVGVQRLELRLAVALPEPIPVGGLPVLELEPMGRA
jgi:hypothetical protein